MSRAHYEEINQRIGISQREAYEEQELSRKTAGGWVRASQRGAGVSGITEYLSRVNAPTLLVYGANGGYRNFSAVGQARLKSARVEIVPESGSFTQQDNPEYTANLMLSFFKEHAGIS